MAGPEVYRYCPGCGAANPTNARYCQQCQRELPSNSAVGRSRPTRSTDPLSGFAEGRLVPMGPIGVALGPSGMLWFGLGIAAAVVPVALALPQGEVLTDVTTHATVGFSPFRNWGTAISAGTRHDSARYSGLHQVDGPLHASAFEQ